MVDLRKTGGQLTAIGSGARNDDDGFGCMDIFIGAIPLIADNGVHVCRISFGKWMGVDPDISSF